MLIAARNALLSGGGGLPYDAEVEYLQSTGTQWIDTGYRMTSDDMRFECDMMQKPSGNAADFFFGYRFTTAATSTGDMRAFFIFGSGVTAIENIGLLAKRYGGGSAGTYSQNKLVMSQRGTVEYTPPNFVVNGVSTAVSTSASSNPSYGSMYLFACNTTGWYSADIGKFVGRIYYFKIWQGNVLVRDFIPVRVGTVGAMYDRANPTVGMDPDGSARTDGLYRNRGTGAFGYGNDI